MEESLMSRGFGSGISYAFALLMAWTVPGAAQSTAARPPDSTRAADLQVERSVQGTVLVSHADPEITLTLPRRFAYAGGQRFLIGPVADAEQHLFVDADAQRLVRRLVWIQFEHRLPADAGSYDYRAPQRVRLGPYAFVTDTKLFADYADTVLSIDSSKGAVDQAHVGRLLRARGYTPPRMVIRARMFYLPDSAHRKELMIIYAKALTTSDLGGRSLPAEAPGTQWPDLSRDVVEEAERDIRIRAPSGHD
jgi:hypothetical protein